MVKTLYKTLEAPASIYGVCKFNKLKKINSERRQKLKEENNNNTWK